MRPCPVPQTTTKCLFYIDAPYTVKPDHLLRTMLLVKYGLHNKFQVKVRFCTDL